MQLIGRVLGGSTCAEICIASNQHQLPYSWNAVHIETLVTQNRFGHAIDVHLAEACGVVIGASRILIGDLDELLDGVRTVTNHARWIATRGRNDALADNQ